MLESLLGFPQSGPLSLLVVQASPFCNLNCSYCYLPDKSVRARMSEAVLEALFRRVVDSGLVRGGFTVVWHAGEPLTLPIDFYKRAFDLIDRINDGRFQINHSFQTNGTILSKSWCELFKSRPGTIVGVSVDGPAFIHDKSRRTRTDRPTHHLVERGMRLLQEEGLDFHTISVLTSLSLRHPDEMFAWFHGLGVRRVCFNVEENEGRHAKSTLGYSAAEKDYRAFIGRFYELVRQHTPRLWVRELSDSVQSLMHSDSKGSSQLTTPFRIITVDYLGNFSTFSPELLGHSDPRYGSYVFGNVVDDTFLSAFGRKNFRLVYRDILRGLKSCERSCGYFKVCRGGAPGNKVFENGTFDSTETLFCRLSKQANSDVVAGVLNGTGAPEALKQLALETIGPSSRC